MNLDFLNLSKGLDNLKHSTPSIQNFITELQNHLKNPKFDSILKNDLYQIDRFEGDNPTYAICQNKRTNDFFNIPKTDMPFDAKEYSILKVVDGKYVRDYQAEELYMQKAKETYIPSVKFKSEI